jgi:lauroyl/myristoyl acyltransferase
MAIATTIASGRGASGIDTVAERSLVEFALADWGEAAKLFAEIPQVAFHQLRGNCPFRDLADWEHLREALDAAGTKLSDSSRARP